MLIINNKSATYTYTTSTFNSDRGLAVKFTREGDADACRVSGETTETLEWAHGHSNVYIRNDSAFPIFYDCWWTREMSEKKEEVTGTLAAGEEKQVTDSKGSDFVRGIFTAIASPLPVYGASL